MILNHSKIRHHRSTNCNTDEGQVIRSNSRYLLDIANQVEGENMVFDLSDGASPTIIRDPADQNALYVLMPMRV